MAAKKISRFVVTTHTGDDDKDCGDGVTVRVYNTKTGDVYLELDDYGVDLVYRNGDDNGWDRPADLAMPLDDAAETALWVEMNHDSGDWVAAFSIDGYTSDGDKLALLSKTAYQRFTSGHSDSYQFPLTYGANTTSPRALALDARSKFPKVFPDKRSR